MENKKLTKFKPTIILSTISYFLLDTEQRESVISRIQMFLRNCSAKYASLETFTHNKTVISYNSINAFLTSSRGKNDKNNAVRESVISAIMNRCVPKSYFAISNRWSKLRAGVEAYVNILVKENGYTDDIHTVTCVPKGGRKFNYDYDVTINDDVTFKVEFKYGASTVNDTPQFVSPMKPSQYLSMSYEDYYYDNYLQTLSTKYAIEMPSKELYMKEVHMPTPQCLQEFQTKYYQGCSGSSKYTGNDTDIEFYNDAKEISKLSISNFIQENEVITPMLSDYLRSTQEGKNYMLYKDGIIRYETVNIDHYEIVSCVGDPDRASFIATTKTGKKMKILLRWKNGNGIAYPAFQISQCK